MLPVSASSRPKIILNNVVLPAPLPPMMPTDEGAGWSLPPLFLLISRPASA
jgi:hypothetical protein